MVKAEIGDGKTVYGFYCEQTKQFYYVQSQEVM